MFVECQLMRMCCHFWEFLSQRQDFAVATWAKYLNHGGSLSPPYSHFVDNEVDSALVCVEEGMATNDGWLNFWHGLMSRLPIRQMNPARIKSLYCKGSKMYASSKVRNTGHITVNLKFVWAQMFGWPRLSLGFTLLTCFLFHLVIAQKFMPPYPTRAFGEIHVTYFWYCCSLSSSTTLVQRCANLRLTKNIFGRWQLQRYWRLQLSRSVWLLEMLISCRQKAFLKSFQKVWTFYCGWTTFPPLICVPRLLFNNLEDDGLSNLAHVPLICGIEASLACVDLEDAPSLPVAHMWGDWAARQVDARL